MRFEEKIFQLMEQFSKLSLDGATIGARMVEKNKNLRKQVQCLCATAFTDTGLLNVFFSFSISLLVWFVQ